MRAFVLLLSLLLCAALCSAQSYNALTSASPSITASLAASTAGTTNQACYSYATGALSTQSDVSVILITSGGFPQLTAYINVGSSTPAPSATFFNKSLTGTGQVQLQTSQTVSSTPVNLLGVGGGTVYVCVVAGQVFGPGGGPGGANTAYTLSFSVTTRMMVSGVNNFTLTLPAMTANSIQYVAWQFPLEVGQWVRGFYSFGAAYTTNVAISSLSIVNTTSLASPQPTLLWSHDVWDQVASVPSADPTLPSALPTRNNVNQGLNNAQGDAFIAYDRDQSYSFPNLASGWYLYAIFVPYAVPSGGVFTLNNVFTTTAASTVTDISGDDFIQTPLPSAGLSGVSLAAGGVNAYVVTMPAGSTIIPNITLTSTSGNADLFVVRTAVLFGAPLNAAGQATDSAAAVYGGGSIVGTGSTYWVGPDVGSATPYVSGFDFSSTNDNGAGGIDSVSFVYTTTATTYYTIFVVGQRASVFSLNVAYSTSPAPVTVFGTGNNNQVTFANNVPGGTVRYYQYTYTGVIDSATDLSVILIAAGTALPVTYVSLTPYPSATNHVAGNFTGSGSLLLHSGNAAYPVNIVTATGTTFYIAVLAGAGTAYWSLAVSSTERLQFSGMTNQSVTLGATPANTLQYFSWQFPAVTAAYARGYFSFAISYSTNTTQNNLGPNGQSYSLNQPAIIWSHQNYVQTSAQQPDPVITNAIPTSTQNNVNAMGFQSYKPGAFVTFDRDQSYPYAVNQTEWYSVGVYIPFSVPAGAVISITNVATAAATATDGGGDDFPLTTLSLAGSANSGSITATGSLQAGQIAAYNVILPTAFFSSQIFMRLQSTGGNADIFATPTPVFVGASSFNYTSGTANDAGNIGYAQGANLGTNGIGNGALVTTYVQNSTGQQGTEFIGFFQNPAVTDAWVVLVFAITPVSYNLTVFANSTVTANVATLPSAGGSYTLAAGGYAFYQYTAPTLSSTTDLSLVLITAGINAATKQGVLAYLSSTFPYPGIGNGAGGAAINGTGSLLLSGASNAQLPTTYNLGLTTGSSFYIGISNPTTGTLNYTLAPSLTNRQTITGLANQSVTLPALAANSIQYILWTFPEQTTGGNRGYYSFAASATTNVAASSLTLTSTPVTAQPYLFWAHTNFNAYTSSGARAIADPTLPQSLPTSSATYPTAAVAVFDRDQTYPSTPPTVYYSFGLYTPYAVPAGSVFTLSSVAASAATATDAGGDDFPLAPLTLGTPVTGTVTAGQVMGYKIACPVSTTASQVTFTLTSTSGNADLFVENAVQFYGLGGPAVFNYSTGTPNDGTGGGYAQGITTIVGGGGWTGTGSAATTTANYVSATDSLTTPDTVSLTYNSTQLQWYVVLVYGQRASTYTLSVAATTISYTDLSSTGSTTVASPSTGTTFYSYTVSSANMPTANTDMAVVLVSPTGSTVQAFVTVGSTVPSSSAAALATINGTGSFLVKSAAAAATPVNYIPASASAVGMQILIGVQVPTGGSANAYTLSISITQRVNITGLTNQTVSMPATAAGALQFISWSFPVETTNYVRNYMSFSAGYSSGLSASAVSTSTIAAAQPSLQWVHNEWQGNNYAPADPSLQQVATGSVSATATQTGTFVTYDRDQSYPNEQVAWYVWALYIPYAVPAGGVFSLSSMNSIANIQAANDNGGNDFITTPLTLNAGAGVTTSIAQSQVLGFNLALPPASGATVTVTLTSVSGQAYLYAATKQAFTGAPALDNYTGSVVENSVGYNQGALYSTAATYGWYEGAAVSVPAFPLRSTADSATNTVTFTYSGTFNSFYTIIVFGAKAGSFQLSATGPTTALLVSPYGSGSSSSSTGGRISQSSTSTASTQSTTSTTTSTAGATTGAGGSSNSSSGLSGGAIAGIVIGSVVGVALLCLIFAALLGLGARRKKTSGGDEDVARQGSGGYESNTGDVEMSEAHNDGETAEE